MHGATLKNPRDDVRIASWIEIARGVPDTEIDVHGMEVVDAEYEILCAARQCKMDGDATLVVIHGHHGGTAIKDRIRSAKFMSWLAGNGHDVVLVNGTGPATTRFTIR